MAYKYKVIKRGNGINKNEKHYAIPAGGRIVISTHDIAKRLSGMSSLTAGDVYNTLAGLSQLIQEYIREGYSVKLDDLGTFSLSITSDGQDSPREVTPQRVRPHKICFQADARLKKEIKKHTKFERNKK